MRLTTILGVFVNIEREECLERGVKTLSPHFQVTTRFAGQGPGTPHATAR